MTTSPTRRRLLQAAGGLTLLAAGGAVWRAHDRGVFVEPSGAPYDPPSFRRRRKSSPTTR